MIFVAARLLNMCVVLYCSTSARSAADALMTSRNISVGRRGLSGFKLPAPYYCCSHSDDEQNLNRNTDNCEKEYPEVVHSDKIPPGRVKNTNEWLRWSSESLKRFTGKSLLDEMDGSIEVLDLVDQNERYGVLSHGIQEDPIYCYANKAALLAFGYSAREFYQLPSRKSAPKGAVRQVRQGIIQGAQEQNFRLIPSAIRQSKDGSIFEITNIRLWNVYNDNGERVGQTAIYDRDQISQLDSWDGQV